MRAESYRPSKEGHDCPVDNPSEPCWGPVEINDQIIDGDGDTIDIWTCSGHEYMMCRDNHYVVEKK